MNRAAVVYLVMIIVLIGGLWTILAIGSTLDAPNDLAGKWQMSPANIRGWGPSMEIEQSGRFFQVFVEHGPQFDLKLRNGSPALMQLWNSTTQLTFSGSALDEKHLRIDGPYAGEWTVKRITRRYPPDPSPRPATQPAMPVASKEVH